MLPGIVPRIREIFRSGFGAIAFLLAGLYNTIGLLPHGHPFLNARNVGRFGIFHVIGEAAANLEWRRENIDRIIMLGVTVIGLVLLVGQFLLFAFAVFFTPALAQGLSFGGIFTTPNPTTDIAFIGMDMVFGVPGIFNSCISTGALCSSDPTDQILQGTGTFPWPFHRALHAMFQLYSIGILVVAAMIVIYYSMAVVAETAQSGTPFGKRFNHVWAPIRLVVALGLLIPLGSGLNSAQYITLYAAKIGSSLATNAWLGFNDDIQAISNSSGRSQNTILGNNTKLIGKPNPPKVQGFLQFLHLAKSCQIAEEYIKYTYNTACQTVNRNGGARTCRLAQDEVEVDLWAIRSNKGAPPSNARCSYNENDLAIKLGAISEAECLWHYFGGGDAIIRVGHQSPQRYPEEIENIGPTCGEFVIPLINPAQSGTGELSNHYIKSITGLWNGAHFQSAGNFDEITRNQFVRRNLSVIGADYDRLGEIEAPEADLKLKWVTAYTNHAKQGVLASYDIVTENIDVSFNQQLREKGWAAAATWYNNIATLNGLFHDTVVSFPYASKYPEVMEYIAQERRKKNANASGDRFSSDVNGTAITFPKNNNSDQEKYAFYYNDVYQWWQTDPITGGGTYNGQELVGSIKDTGNPFINTINLIFGTTGLFDMRENADVHPLAQLANLGKGIMNSTILQIIGGLTGIGAQIFGGLAGRDEVFIIGGIASKFTFSVASIGLTAGFLLYYILPFLPFIYFFFAVIGWIKGIFEAMVGVPLWALAHIRIDGQGLPGDAAVTGYVLILEIIFRPIMILFGMLASITIFAAAVQVLNDIFDLVITNLAGYNEAHRLEDPGITDAQFYRDPVDQFFYTVIYAVIVYLLGTSCFKLIDQIPSKIFRWAGQNTPTFNDQSQEAAVQGITQYAAIGGVQVFSQGLGALQKGGEAVGGVAKALSGPEYLNTAKPKK